MVKAVTAMMKAVKTKVMVIIAMKAMVTVIKNSQKLNLIQLHKNSTKQNSTNP